MAGREATRTISCKIFTSLAIINNSSALCGTSLEFEYLHRIRRCEMLTGADDICYDVITRGTYFSMFFFYVRTCLRFALIGGNLTAQTYISRNLPNTSVRLGSGV